MIQDALKAFTTATAVVLLLFNGPPVESLIGRLPLPIAVGMAQTSEPGGVAVVGPSEATILQWGIREGGAFVVILVILFFYRRDWKTAVEFWRDQHAITTDLVIKATQAQSKTASALSENTTVLHSMKQVIQSHIPIGRRQEDTR